MVRPKKSREILGLHTEEDLATQVAKIQYLSLLVQQRDERPTRSYYE